jgi:hypothetical protein
MPYISAAYHALCLGSPSRMRNSFLPSHMQCWNALHIRIAIEDDVLEYIARWGVFVVWFSYITCF